MLWEVIFKLEKGLSQVVCSCAFLTPMGVWELEVGALFRCHSEEVHIAISEEPGIISIHQCVRQSYAQNLSHPKSQ